MTLSTSIIITSVTLALLQYFDTSNQNRVKHAGLRLREEFANHVLDDLNTKFTDNPTATKIRETYDNLVNFSVEGANVLLNTLFVVFALVVLLHSVHTVASLDDLAKVTQDTIVKVVSYVRVGLDFVLAAIVLLVGGRLYQTNRTVTEYQRSVDKAISNAKTAVSLARAAVNPSNSERE